LYQQIALCGPAWPETDDPRTKDGFWHDRWRAIVEIRNRRAIGMLVLRQDTEHALILFGGGNRHQRAVALRQAADRC
jgi:hypothetical protein